MNSRHRSMREIPHKAQARIEDTLRALNIEIPVKRNSFVFAFLSFWLCVWMLGELMVLVMLLATIMQVSINGMETLSMFSIDFLFLSFWFTAWTFGGFFAFRNWLWMFKGREIIVLSREELIIEKKYSLFTPVKSYDIKEIKNIQINTSLINIPFLGNLANFNMPGMVSGGSLKFDYGFKTIPFAAGLDEAEARYILEKINSKGFIKEN